MASNTQEMDLADCECPVCTEYLWPPIYKCNNSHFLCKKCIRKVSLCPICRENLPIPKIRHKVLESAVTRFLRPCEFSTTGCKARVKLCNMESHIKICKFRTGRHCATLGIPDCKTAVSFVGLVDHARTAHGVPTISVHFQQEFDVEQLVSSGRAQSFTGVSWKPVLIFVKASSNVFLLRTSFDSGKIRWTIQDILIYRTSSAGDHTAVISFIKGPSEKCCQTWTGPVLKHDANLEDMNSWFILPSTNIEGRSAWNLRISIQPGIVTSRVDRPACIAINEVSVRREEPARPAAAPRTPAPLNQQHSARPATATPRVEPSLHRPHIPLPEILRRRSSLTCSVCQHFPISVPKIVRAARDPLNSLFKAVPYCQSCFSDYRGSINEIFFVVPQYLEWVLEGELRRLMRKENIYEEHVFIFPPSLGFWFALRRFVRLVASANGWLGVYCDWCNNPILGWRFQCTQCLNLNLCRRCCLEEKKHEGHVVLVTSTRRFRYLLKQRLFWKLAVPWLLGLLIPYWIARTFILPRSWKIMGLSALVCNSLLVGLLSMPV